MGTDVTRDKPADVTGRSSACSPPATATLAATFTIPPSGLASIAESAALLAGTERVAQIVRIKHTQS
jgi:hypothetical protein